jgi:hypothetical protein
VCIVLAIRPKVSGFSPSRGRCIKGNKNPSPDFLSRGKKPAVHCRKILRHIKDPYSMKEIIEGKIHGHFSPSFFICTSVSPGYCQRALVAESGVGKPNRSVMVAVHGMLCATPPHKQ